MRLTEHIREQEGEVYSPSVQVAVNKYPKSDFRLMVGFGCAPANVKHLMELVDQDINGLKSSGITEDYVQKYKAAFNKGIETELNSNVYWMEYLSRCIENKEDILHILDADKLLAQVTVAALRATAARHLRGDNEIRFVLLPEKMAPKTEE